MPKQDASVYIIICCLSLYICDDMVLWGNFLDSLKGLDQDGVCRAISKWFPGSMTQTHSAAISSEEQGAEAQCRKALKNRHIWLVEYACEGSGICLCKEYVIVNMRKDKKDGLFLELLSLEKKEEDQVTLYMTVFLVNPQQKDENNSSRQWTSIGWVDTFTNIEYLYLTKIGVAERMMALWSIEDDVKVKVKRELLFVSVANELPSEVMPQQPKQKQASSLLHNSSIHALDALVIISEEDTTKIKKTPELNKEDKEVLEELLSFLEGTGQHMNSKNLKYGFDSFSQGYVANMFEKESDIRKKVRDFLKSTSIRTKETQKGVDMRCKKALDALYEPQIRNWNKAYESQHSDEITQVLHECLLENKPPILSKNDFKAMLLVENRVELPTRKRNKLQNIWQIMYPQEETPVPRQSKKNKNSEKKKKGSEDEDEDDDEDEEEYVDKGKKFKRKKLDAMIEKIVLIHRENNVFGGLGVTRIKDVIEVIYNIWKKFIESRDVYNNEKDDENFIYLFCQPQNKMIPFRKMGSTFIAPWTKYLCEYAAAEKTAAWTCDYSFISLRLFIALEKLQGVSMQEKMQMLDSAYAKLSDSSSSTEVVNVERSRRIKTFFELLDKSLVGIPQVDREHAMMVWKPYRKLLLLLDEQDPIFKAMQSEVKKPEVILLEEEDESDEEGSEEDQSPKTEEVKSDFNSQINFLKKRFFAKKKTIII